MSTKRPIPERRSLRRRLRMEFSSVDHLSPEVVAAFVDGELSDGAEHRARVHVVHCAECRAEVHAQRGAAEAVRGSNTEECVRAPHTLVERLAWLASQQQEQGDCQPDTRQAGATGAGALEGAVKALFRRS